MRLATIRKRLLPRIVTPAVWMLIGTMALASAGQVAAAVSPQPAAVSPLAAAVALRPGACAASAPCASQGPVPPLLIIDTGAPDGFMAMASRLEGHSQIEIEAADDFSVTADVRVFQATITGLLTGTAPLSNIEDVDLEMYRIFPLDSDTGRTIQVPTRVNSPSDVDFGQRSASADQLVFSAALLDSNFNASNSVLNGIHKKPNQTTGGDGAVNGEEVKISITLREPFVLQAGHYFFIPKVKLSSGTWFWLSAGSPPHFPGDLQAWIRDSNLDPDWLRVGTDIVGSGKFNASFSLSAGREVFLPVVLR